METAAKGGKIWSIGGIPIASDSAKVCLHRLQTLKENLDEAVQTTRKGLLIIMAQFNVHSEMSKATYRLWFGEDRHRMHGSLYMKRAESQSLLQKG